MDQGQGNERRFDSPKEGSDDFELYEETPMDKAKEMGGQAADLVKAHKKKIIAGIIAVVVLFFVYDFFVGSIKEITFGINDTEGQQINGASIRLFGADGKTIETISSGDSISLRRGEYFYSISASSYKQVQKKTLEVDDAAEINEVLEKNMDVMLSLAQSFPEKIVTGQVLTLNASIKNNSKTEQEIELVFEGGLKEATTQSYDTPLVVPGGAEKSVQITIEVKKDLSSTEIKNAKSGVIRIKGLNNTKAKQSVSFEITEFEPRDLQISGNLNFGAIKEGNPPIKKSIKIRNNADFDIENLAIEIPEADIVSQFSQPSQVKNWFSFTPSLPIPIIRKGTEQNVEISIHVPVGIEFGENALQETITGTMNFRTSFDNRTIVFNVVAQKNQTDLQIQGVSNLTMSFNDQAQEYDTKTMTIRLKNDGGLKIKNVSVTARCQNNAPITFSLSEDLFEIEAQETKTVIATINASSTLQTGSINTCSINASYDNPRNTQPLVLEKEQPFTITTN